MKKLFTLAIAIAAAMGVSQNLQTQVYVSGLSFPVGMYQDPTDPSVQFVVEQRGRIRIIQNGVLLLGTFLDLSGIVHQTHNEGGLLGLAFHPQYASNGLLYVNYTDTAGDTRIVRYTRDVGNPLLVNPGTAQQVLFIDQPFSNHNGGSLRFGPNDGFLYIGMGDGGSGNDPGNRAQTITNMLLGKFLRIDVNGDAFPADPTKNYAIPASNPFVGITGDDEIWSFGIRNPWKFTFDNPALLGSGGMLIGDVGQSAFEELNYEPPLAGGRNYGWRQWEGNQSTGLGGGNGGPYTFPVHAYGRSQGASVTGGYVYRGLLLGDYFGKYFYADYVHAKTYLFDLVINPVTGEGSAANPTEITADLAAGAQFISSVDVDAAGELYLSDYRGSGAGRILKILPENRAWINSVQPDITTPVIGNARALNAADGKVLRTLQLESVTVGRLFQSAFFVNMQTDMTAPSFFDVFFDIAASDSVGNANVRAEIRNWTTGQLITLGTFPVTTTMTTRQILNIPAGDYRRPSDGAIQLRFYVANPGNYDTSRFSISYDRVKLVPRV